MCESLGGIIPEAVRALRLGKSQGSEHMALGYDGRVPRFEDAPL